MTSFEIAGVDNDGVVDVTTELSEPPPDCLVAARSRALSCSTSTTQQAAGLP